MPFNLATWFNCYVSVFWTFHWTIVPVEDGIACTSLLWVVLHGKICLQKNALSLQDRLINNDIYQIFIFW